MMALRIFHCNCSWLPFPIRNAIVVASVLASNIPIPIGCDIARRSIVVIDTCGSTVLAWTLWPRDSRLAWYIVVGYGQESYERREEEDLSLKGNLIEDELLLHILELSCWIVSLLRKCNNVTRIFALLARAAPLSLMSSLLLLEKIWM